MVYTVSDSVTTVTPVVNVASVHCSSHEVTVTTVEVEQVSVVVQ